MPTRWFFFALLIVSTGISYRKAYTEKQGVQEMVLQVHPVSTMLRGDGKGYNARSFNVWTGANRSEMVEGVFQDDGRTDGGARRPDIPFSIVLPADFGAWQALNTRIFYALQEQPTRIFIDAGIL